MSRSQLATIVIFLVASLPLQAENWSRWRGPHNTGMATGSAPLNWSATENIKWSADIPGLAADVAELDRIEIRPPIEIDISQKRCVVGLLLCRKCPADVKISLWGECH